MPWSHRSNNRNIIQAKCCFTSQRSQCNI